MPACETEPRQVPEGSFRLECYAACSSLLLMHLLPAALHYTRVEIRVRPSALALEIERTEMDDGINDDGLTRVFISKNLVGRMSCLVMSIALLFELIGRKCGTIEDLLLSFIDNFHYTFSSIYFSTLSRTLCTPRQTISRDFVTQAAARVYTLVIKGGKNSCRSSVEYKLRGGSRSFSR